MVSWLGWRHLEANRLCRLSVISPQTSDLSCQLSVMRQLSFQSNQIYLYSLLLNLERVGFISHKTTEFLSD